MKICQGIEKMLSLTWESYDRKRREVLFKLLLISVFQRGKKKHFIYNISYVLNSTVLVLVSCISLNIIIFLYVFNRQ